MTEREWEQQAWGHTWEPEFAHGTHDSRRPGWGSCLAAGCLFLSAALLLGTLLMAVARQW